MENEITYENIMQCDKCNNTGFVYKLIDGNHVAAYCECFHKRHALIALKKSGLEDAVNDNRFDNFEMPEEYQKRMYDICCRFITQKDKPFLYIGGQTGCGKTHLGTAVCKHYIDKGVSTIYTTHKMLLNDLKSKVNDEEYADMMAHYGRAEVLYIDDFFKTAKYEDREKMTPPTASDIQHTFELINMRTVGHKKTIITSERSLDEIVGIDEALGGRIKQRCGEFAISIAVKAGRNWRLKGIKPCQNQNAAAR